MSTFKWDKIIDASKFGNTKASTLEIFVIGYNYFGELDSVNKHNILKLTQLETVKGDHLNIYSGNGRTIYKTYNKGLYIAGNNHFGSCGINIKSDIVPLTYVESKHIKQIFTNVCSDSIFIKTKKNKIFAAGRISQIGTGPTKYPFNRYKPIAINYLNNNPLNIVDIQSGTEFSIALCGFDSSKDATIIIIENWAALSTIPTDIIELIRKYYYIINKVYITKSIEYNYHSPKPEPCQDYKVCRLYRYSTSANNCDCIHYFCHGLTSATQWKPIEWSNDGKHIIKIASASVHYLLLEANGNVWQTTDIYSLKLISFFKGKKQIRIKDIKCGNQHNLAIDYNGKLYSWGSNNMGQCGIINSSVSKWNPQLVKELIKYQICEIKCGYAHSYCKTLNNKHYMFGSNVYNECILYDKNINIVKLPHCFNETVKEQIICLNVQSVSLGYYNTKIIVRKYQNENVNNNKDDNNSKIIKKKKKPKKVNYDGFINERKKLKEKAQLGHKKANLQRKELLKLNQPQLARKCRELNLSQKGTKADLVNRLMQKTKERQKQNEQYQD